MENNMDRVDWVEYYNRYWEYLSQRAVGRLTENNKKSENNMCKCKEAKNNRDDSDFDLGDFILVNDGLPEDKDQEVEVIYYCPYSAKCKTSSSKFDPATGWSLGNPYKIIAWKDQDSDIVEFMEFKTKQINKERKTDC